MLTKYTPLFVIMIVASVIGFIIENVWLAFQHGFIDNRGMAFPALIGYGMAVVAFYIILGVPSRPAFLGYKLPVEDFDHGLVFYFIATLILVSVGEIVLGTAVERFTGIIWWDYSNLPMHLTRYTSLPTSAGFAFMIVLFMEYCFKPMFEYTASIQTPAMFTYSAVILVVLSVDFIHSANYMIKNHRVYDLWKRQINLSKDNKTIFN
ncbi:MAG: putative ABC transporter permease [Lachnospiraceae bacterium]|nr:putative ABC transporter permease [Lachnospiraceae bacterium]